MNFTYYFRPSPPRLLRCSLVVQRISNFVIYEVKKFYCIKGSEWNSTHQCSIQKISLWDFLDETQPQGPCPLG
jgi:hypothetical protein